VPVLLFSVSLPSSGIENLRTFEISLVSGTLHSIQNDNTSCASQPTGSGPASPPLDQSRDRRDNMPGARGAAASSTRRRHSSRTLHQLHDFCDEVERQIAVEGGGEGNSPSSRAAAAHAQDQSEQSPSVPVQGSQSRQSSNLSNRSRSGRFKQSLADRAGQASDRVSNWVDDMPEDRPTWIKQTLRGIKKFRLVTGLIVNDDRVQILIVLMISINAIMMGLATFDFVSKNPQVDAAFEKTDTAFLIIFTIELCMQFIYHGFRLFLDGWLVFDFIIILLSWAFASAQIIRAFRIFRALRLITRVEVMRNLVTALFSVMPRMAAIGLLLFLIFYIFAVMFTSLFKTLYRQDLTEWDYFGRLDATFFTLFQIMTLDEWSAVAREVMLTYAWAWAPFVAFVIISGFVVVNLIIAVICDAISALHDDARANLYGQQLDSDSEGDGGDGAAGGSPRSGGGARGGRHGHGNAELDASEAAKEQVDSLEKQIEDLLLVQQQSMRALENLTREVEKAREADSGESQIGERRTFLLKG